MASIRNPLFSSFMGRGLIRGMMAAALPIAATFGADGRKFGLGFDLRMPTKWNGWFAFQGGDVNNADSFMCTK